MRPELIAAVRSSDHDRRTEILTTELRAGFARYLGVAPSEVDADEPIALLGMDSLTAAQLALDIEEQIGVSVFLTELTGDETIAKLAAVAGEELASGGGS